MKCRAKDIVYFPLMLILLPPSGEWVPFYVTPGQTEVSKPDKRLQSRIVTQCKAHSHPHFKTATKQKGLDETRLDEKNVAVAVAVAVAGAFDVVNLGSGG